MFVWWMARQARSQRGGDEREREEITTKSPWCLLNYYVIIKKQIIRGEGSF